MDTDIGKKKFEIEETKFDNSQTKPEKEKIKTNEGELKYKDGPQLLDYVQDLPEYIFHSNSNNHVPDFIFPKKLSYENHIIGF